MADEVETPDPLAALLEKHVARMEDITTSGLKHMELVSGNLVDKLKRNIGLRSEVLDGALKTLGIKPLESDE